MKYLIIKMNDKRTVTIPIDHSIDLKEDGEIGTRIKPYSLSEDDDRRMYFIIVRETIDYITNNLAQLDTLVLNEIEDYEW